MAKKIVIVGGAHAGTQSSIGLDKILKPEEAQITLISRSTHFYFNIGAPRVVVDQKFADSAFISLDKIFTKPSNKLVIGLVTSVVEGKVILDNGTEIPYDILIICTGTAFGAPHKPVFKTKEDGIEIVAGAKRIIVAGGGASGCEFVGEIKYRFPDKEVTLIHNGPRLLSTSKVSDAFKDKLKRKIEKLGVTVILEDRINRVGAKENVVGGTKVYNTAKEVSIEADCIIWCIGIGKFNSELMKTLPGDILNEKGEVKVGPTLQLSDTKYPNIFSYGDVATTGAPKMVMPMGGQTAVVVANVAAMVRGQPVKKEYHHNGKDAIGVTLGPKKALAEIAGMPWFLTNRIIKLIKSPFMFVDKATKDLHQN